jgi:hypothetical protein
VADYLRSPLKDSCDDWICFLVLDITGKIVPEIPGVGAVTEPITRHDIGSSTKLRVVFLIECIILPVTLGGRHGVQEIQGKYCYRCIVSGCALRFNLITECSWDRTSIVGIQCESVIGTGGLSSLSEPTRFHDDNCDLQNTPPGRRGTLRPRKLARRRLRSAQWSSIYCGHRVSAAWD